MDLIPTSGPHLHVLLNHFPSVGTVIAVGLFITSYHLKSEDLKRASLVLFLLLGLIAIPTYISGAAARWAIQGNDGISQEIITAHMDVALMSFTFLGITGCLAWLALWQERRFASTPKWNLIAVLVTSLISLLYMSRTGNIGGHINHPELGPVETLTAPGEGLTASVENLITSVIWAWPAMEAAHFIGMALIFGVVLLVGLRSLGVAKNLPYSALHRLLPLGALGLLVNVITGFFFFIADSGRYVAMDGFPPKIIALMIGGIAIIYFTIFDDAWSLKAGDDAPLLSKAMAVVTIGSWAAVLVFGRLLPYYGDGG
jgi:predicted small integral membrane protein